MLYVIFTILQELSTTALQSADELERMATMTAACQVPLRRPEQERLTAVPPAGHSDRAWTAEEKSGKGSLSAVLLVSENADLGVFVSQALPANSYSIRLALGAPEGLKLSLHEPFDLILLDASLTGLGAVALLLEIRARSMAPVLLLADSETDCLQAIESGVDDFLLKPLRSEEITLRADALLRKRKLNSGGAHMLQCENLVVDTRTQQVWLEGRPLKLTGSEFCILKSLLRSLCRIVSRDEIALMLYQRQATPFERSIDVHVSHLRKKIEHSRSILIRTIRGVGYSAVPSSGGGYPA